LTCKNRLAAVDGDAGRADESLSSIKHELETRMRIAQGVKDKCKWLAEGYNLASTADWSHANFTIKVVDGQPLVQSLGASAGGGGMGGAGVYQDGGNDEDKGQA
jgi:hypothetical protein